MNNFNLNIIGKVNLNLHKHILIKFSLILKI